MSHKSQKGSKPARSNLFSAYRATAAIARAICATIRTSGNCGCARTLHVTSLPTDSDAILLLTTFTSCRDHEVRIAPLLSWFFRPRRRLSALSASLNTAGVPARQNRMDSAGKRADWAREAARRVASMPRPARRQPQSARIRPKSAHALIL